MISQRFCGENNSKKATKLSINSRPFAELSKMGDLFLINIRQLTYLRNLHVRLCTSIRITPARHRLKSISTQFGNLGKPEMIRGSLDAGSVKSRKQRPWNTSCSITRNSPLANKNSTNTMMRQLKKHL